MITEDYVSFETAKLLKEKGFDEEIETLIEPDGSIYFLDENSISKTRHIKIKNSDINIYSDSVSCPTIQMAMKWLRNIHGFFILINVIGEAPCWFADIQGIKGDVSIYLVEKEFPNYEKACEAAIKYCLENLI